jgi:hypothetical protein
MSYIQIQKGGRIGRKHAKYVHLAWNEWDSSKRQSVQHRFYVGRLGNDGKVVVNKKFSGGGGVCVTEEELRARATDRNSFEVWLRETASGPSLSGGVARVDIVGDGWVARHLASESGLAGLLDEVFGAVDGGALAGLAAHQFVTAHALYRAGAWLSQREMPATWKGSQVSESSVHGFVARIGEDTGRREKFLERWAGLHKGARSVLHDITSVSSYSPSLELAEWGHNRDDENLPQVNFSLAATADGMPLFYRVIPGSIPDVRTLSTSIRIARDYGVETPCLSLDRGFYSQSNLRDLLGLKCAVLIGVPWSVKQASVLFKKHASHLESPRHGFLYRGVPLRHIADKWMLDNVTLTLHLYFDPGRHADLSLRCEKTVLALAAKASHETFRNGREAKAWIVENAGTNASCLGVIKGANGTPQIATKPNRIAASTARAGYTLVLTHGRDKKQETGEAVLHDYRARDIAEKLFDAFKTDDGQYRLRTANDNSVQGRFFLGFIALILRAELENRMHAADLHKSMTTAAVIDEMGKAKALVTRQGNRILLEVSKKQRSLLAALRLPELT